MRLTALERVAGLTSIPVALLMWEVIVRAGWVNPVLFPPPSVVAVAFGDYALHGTMLEDVAWSLSRVLVGFTVGTAAGILMGVLTGGNRLASRFFGPVFHMLRPIPPIAFVPIVIVWFGLTELGKWFLVFWGVFFTVWLSAHLGVQRVNPTFVRAAQCLGAPPWRVLLEVLLPGALPVIFVGIRTAMGVSFFTLVAAELAGAFSGIAYRLEVTQQNMQIGHMISGLILLGLVATIADWLFGLLSTKVVHWHSA